MMANTVVRCIFFACMISFLLGTPVNVVSIVDESSVESCLIKVYSIIKSASPSRPLYFGFLIIGDSENVIADTIHSAFKTCHFRGDVDIKHWSAPRAVTNLTQHHFDKDVIYARFYLPLIFKHLDRYLYLDNDLIVNCDVSILFDIPLVSGFASELSGRSSPRQSVRQEYNVAGFVFERNRIYDVYLSSHLNVKHPLVQRLFQVRPTDTFLNGGVALIDAERWRQDGYTARAEKLIEQNRRSFIFDNRIADQGLFALLLLHRVTFLPPKYNMRRQPNRSILLLEKNELGVVHFAGSTYGDETSMCKRPTQYPHFLSAVMPLYLSIVTALHKSCPAIPWKMKEVCAEGVVKLQQRLIDDNITVSYNPGRGKFTWPPRI